jgi:hypothetical protein
VSASPTPTPVAQKVERRLRAPNLTSQMNSLIEAVRENPFSEQTIEQGYSKDKKVIAEQQITSINRWGMWVAFDSYSDGRNLYEADFGVDYRITPHWLIGADARLGVLNRGSEGLALAQGGLYTAFYEKGWYAVAGGLFGPNEGTAYTEVGYDFHAGPLIFGPVANVQYDDDTVNNGFGRGQLFESRFGGRFEYIGWPVYPFVQVMYQNQTIDEEPQRRNAVWAGAGLAWPISPTLSIYGGYSFEGNSNYQINQGILGIRFQF